MIWFQNQDIQAALINTKRDKLPSIETARISNFKLIVVILLALLVIILTPAPVSRSLSPGSRSVTRIPTASPQPSKPPITPTPASVTIAGVPFTSQSPFGQWSDPRQQDACEEASALIAIYWAQNKPLSPESALTEILRISRYQEQVYGEYHDTSAQDTLSWIILDYFKYPEAYVKNSITIGEIISQLQSGNLVIVPTNGQLLGNPNFTSPGPERHMLVITGYDVVNREFITQDPGTRMGKNYRYDQNVLFTAIRDYPTGYHQPITPTPKNMIVVAPSK